MTIITSVTYPVVPSQRTIVNLETFIYLPVGVEYIIIIDMESSLWKLVDSNNEISEGEAGFVRWKGNTIGHTVLYGTEEFNNGKIIRLTDVDFNKPNLCHKFKDDLYGKGFGFVLVKGVNKVNIRH